MLDKNLELASHVLSSLTFGICVAAICYVVTHVPQGLSKALLVRSTFLNIKFTQLSPSVEDFPEAEVTKELDFPEAWWSSEKLYDLEQRAIISKTWLHVTHSSLFRKPGDYRRFTIGNFDFIVILGKDRKIRAFHNVCRHRAYTVCSKSAGSSLALRCKYHGWTYDSQGKLIKAPKFDEVAGFNKSQNGLFAIRTFVDTSGFIYANFDVYGSDGLTIRVGMPIKARLSLIESWNVEGDFNWKYGITPGAFRLRSLAKVSRLARMFNSISSVVETWTWPEEFELSPLTKMIRAGYGNIWLTISVVPISSRKSNIECALFSSHDTGIQHWGPLLTAVKEEVRDSVQNWSGSFKIVVESGEVTDLKTQEPILQELMGHSRLEKLLRKEVFPASRLQETSQSCQVADDLCRELEAEAAAVPGDSQNPYSW